MVCDLRNICDRYCAEMKEWSNQGIANSHFNHVARNLLNNLYSIIPNVQGEIGWKKKRISFLANISALRRYFRLMREFPSFRHAELQTQMDEGGYFQVGLGRKLEYSNLEKRLHPPVSSGAYLYVAYASGELLRNEFSLSFIKNL